jgi:GT2 family glycosyltransferase
MIDCLNTKQTGIVGARLLYPNSTLQHAGVIFGPKYGNLPYHYRHKEVSDANAERNREFQAVTAAFMLVRAAVWMEVGGFDQGYSWCY